MSKLLRGDSYESRRPEERAGELRSVVEGAGKRKEPTWDIFKRCIS